jgi:hypothetical protein
MSQWTHSDGESSDVLRLSCTCMKLFYFILLNLLLCIVQVAYSLMELCSAPSRQVLGRGGVMLKCTSNMCNPCDDRERRRT